MFATDNAKNEPLSLGDEDCEEDDEDDDDDGHRHADPHDRS